MHQGTIGPTHWSIKPLKKPEFIQWFGGLFRENVMTGNNYDLRNTLMVNVYIYIYIYIYHHVIYRTCINDLIHILFIPPLWLTFTFPEGLNYWKEQFRRRFLRRCTFFRVSLTKTHLIQDVTLFSNSWWDNEASRICQALHCRCCFAVVTPHIRTMQRHRGFQVRVDGHKITKRYLGWLQFVTKCKKNPYSKKLRPSWWYHDQVKRWKVTCIKRRRLIVLCVICLCSLSIFNFCLRISQWY